MLELLCVLALLDTLDRTVGSRRHAASVNLTVRPVDMASCEVTFTEELQEQISPEIKEAVENGVQSSYLQGKSGFKECFPLSRNSLNCPLTLDIKLLSFREECSPSTLLYAEGQICASFCRPAVGLPHERRIHSDP